MGHKVEGGVQKSELIDSGREGVIFTAAKRSNQLPVLHDARQTRLQCIQPVVIGETFMMARTIFGRSISPDMRTPRPPVARTVTLAPGAFMQMNRVLASSGSGTQAWASIERVGGSAPWLAYASINGTARSGRQRFQTRQGITARGASKVTFCRIAIPRHVQALPQSKD
jgi:hypothetical protein